MMHFLSRIEINELLEKKLTLLPAGIPALQQSGDLPYLSVCDKYRILSVAEVASFFGFDPKDFRDFFLTYPKTIPSLSFPAGIAFDRTTFSTWYLQSALPLLLEG
jgi:hypothetical protein